jgi:hypothetical protein
MKDMKEKNYTLFIFMVFLSFMVNISFAITLHESHSLQRPRPENPYPG